MRAGKCVGIPTKAKGIPSGEREAEVVRSCLEVLRMRGIFCWRQNSGAFRTERGGFFRACGISGVSDILGILDDGRFLAVECKREKGGRLSVSQADFLREVQKRGGVAIVAHSAAELADALREACA